jgi:large subunit ribosomal protein L22
MEVRAEAKYIRMSPRKVRLVVKAIKDMKPEEALAALKFMTRKAAKPITKVIKSAIANATNNFKLDANKLRFKKIQVGEGPTYKRRDKSKREFRLGIIRKRTSHVEVVLEGEK